MCQLIHIAIIWESTQWSYLVKYYLEIAITCWNNFYIFILLYTIARNWNKSFLYIAICIEDIYYYVYKDSISSGDLLMSKLFPSHKVRYK